MSEEVPQLTIAVDSSVEISPVQKAKWTRLRESRSVQVSLLWNQYHTSRSLQKPKNHTLKFTNEDF